MRRHDSDELLRFLQAVDERLERPAQLIVIGGAAAALAYGAQRATSDIDVNKRSGDLKANFFVLISRLFGEQTAREVDEQLADWSTV